MKESLIDDLLFLGGDGRIFGEKMMDYMHLSPISDFNFELLL